MASWGKIANVAQSFMGGFQQGQQVMSPLVAMSQDRRDRKRQEELTREGWARGERLANQARVDTAQDTLGKAAGEFSGMVNNAEQTLKSLDLSDPTQAAAAPGALGRMGQELATAQGGLGAANTQVSEQVLKSAPGPVQGPIGPGGEIPTLSTPATLPLEQGPAVLSKVQQTAQDAANISSLYSRLQGMVFDAPMEVAKALDDYRGSLVSSGVTEDRADAAAEKARKNLQRTRDEYFVTNYLDKNVPSTLVEKAANLLGVSPTVLVQANATIGDRRTKEAQDRKLTGLQIASAEMGLGNAAKDQAYQEFNSKATLARTISLAEPDRALSIVQNAAEQLKGVDPEYAQAVYDAAPYIVGASREESVREQLKAFNEEALKPDTRQQFIASVASVYGGLSPERVKELETTDAKSKPLQPTEIGSVYRSYRIALRDAAKLPALPEDTEIEKQKAAEDVIFAGAARKLQEAKAKGWLEFGSAQQEVSQALMNSSDPELGKRILARLQHTGAFSRQSPNFLDGIFGSSKSGMFTGKEPVQPLGPLTLPGMPGGPAPLPKKPSPPAGIPYPYQEPTM